MLIGRSRIDVRHSPLRIDLSSQIYWDLTNSAWTPTKRPDSRKSARLFCPLGEPVVVRPARNASDKKKKQNRQISCWNHFLVLSPCSKPSCAASIAFLARPFFCGFSPAWLRKIFDRMLKCQYTELTASHYGFMPGKRNTLSSQCIVQQLKKKLVQIYGDKASQGPTKNFKKL